MPGTVVLGLGSPLMGDDGLGLRALEALRRLGRFDPEPEWVDGGTWGMNLLPCIESAERLLLIDAIRTGGTAGALVALPRHLLPRGLGVKLSPHQIDLQEVLALAELRGTLPAAAVALGVEPAHVELGCGLSEPVRRGFDALVQAALRQLGDWGHHLELGSDGMGAIAAAARDADAELLGLGADRFAARGSDGL